MVRRWNEARTVGRDGGLKGLRVAAGSRSLVATGLRAGTPFLSKTWVCPNIGDIPYKIPSKSPNMAIFTRI